MNKSTTHFLLFINNKKQKIFHLRRYLLTKSTKMDDIEMGKKVAAYRAIDENINDVRRTNSISLRTI